MTSLQERLAQRIRRLGPMTLADYMAAVLTDPEAGYYMTADPLGARGDFVTAPEISQMFGELLGLWACDLWQRLGRPDPVILAELGPGRGTLMADALRAARALPGFREAVRVHLVEVSPVLREAQRQALAEAEPEIPVAWQEHPGGLPEGPLLLIANEFFDALPIRQIERTEQGWQERLVALAPDETSLVFTLGPPTPALAALVPERQREAPLGSLVEVSPAGVSLAAWLGRRLAAAGGGALIVDYGAAEPDPGATLQAVRRHRPAEVLEAPGSADLTAHVDFGALAASAAAAGVTVLGPIGQGLFLERLGIGQRAARLSAGSGAVAESAIHWALRRLTHPEEMGELFQVMALAHPLPGGAGPGAALDSLPGFA